MKYSILRESFTTIQPSPIKLTNLYVSVYQLTVKLIISCWVPGILTITQMTFPSILPTESTLCLKGEVQSWSKESTWLSWHLAVDGLRWWYDIIGCLLHHLSVLQDNAKHYLKFNAHIEIKIGNCWIGWYDNPHFISYFITSKLIYITLKKACGYNNAVKRFDGCHLLFLENRQDCLCPQAMSYDAWLSDIWSGWNRTWK